MGSTHPNTTTAHDSGTGGVIYAGVRIPPAAELLARAGQMTEQAKAHYVQLRKTLKEENVTGDTQSNFIELRRICDHFIVKAYEQLRAAVRFSIDEETCNAVKDEKARGLIKEHYASESLGYGIDIELTLHGLSLGEAKRSWQFIISATGLSLD